MKVLSIIFLIIPFLSCTNSNHDTWNAILTAEGNYYREAFDLQDSIYYTEISSLKELADINPNKYCLSFDRAVRIANKSDSTIHELQLRINDHKEIQDLIFNYIEYCFHWADVSYVYEIPSLESLKILTTEKVLNPFVKNKHCQTSLINHVSLLIKVAKIDLVKYFTGYPVRYERSYNTYFPVILYNRNPLSVGEKFEAMIALCAADTTLTPKILLSIDNEDMKEIEVNKNGTGTVSRIFYNPGIKQINGIYRLSWWGSTDIDMPFSSTVHVK
jgi:hypothetical protein